MRLTPTRASGWVAIVFGVLSPLFFVFAVHGYRAVQPIPGGVTTTGTVVRVTGSSKETRAIISFTTRTGEELTFTGPGESTTAIKSGQTVRVSYDPANPADARDMSAGGEAWIFSLILGFTCGLYPVIYVIQHRRKLAGLMADLRASDRP